MVASPHGYPLPPVTTMTQQNHQLQPPPPTFLSALPPRPPPDQLLYGPSYCLCFLVRMVYSVLHLLGFINEHHMGGTIPMVVISHSAMLFRSTREPWRRILIGASLSAHPPWDLAHYSIYLIFIPRITTGFIKRHRRTPPALFGFVLCARSSGPRHSDHELMRAAYHDV